MQSAFYFILLLGGLIFFHELGHFLVARLMGVRVETFSIGFGPALLKWKRGHTLYKIALVPLGGFVKMFGDEVDSQVPVEERQHAFNYKPLWQRSLVVFAGPFFNLLLPLLVFFPMFLTYTELTPSYIGAVQQDGPAWKAGIRAGDEVVSVDGRPISTWWQLETAINASAGKTLKVGIKRGEETFETPLVPEEDTVVRVKELGLEDKVGRIQVMPVYLRPLVAVEEGSAAFAAGLRTWDLVVSVDGQTVGTLEEALASLATPGPKKLTVLRQEPLGVAGPAAWSVPGAPLDLSLPDGAGAEVTSSEFIVHRVDPGTPAETIGLKAGDRVLTLNGKTTPLWSQLIYGLADKPQATHTLEYQRGNEITKAQFQLVETSEKGEFNEERRTVVFGAYNHGSYGVPELVPNPALVGYAATQTWDRTVDAVEITALSLAGLFKGRVKMKDMGGPIMIYDMAAKTSEHGWEYFFRIMVWLSVSLGIINLVPIPILDGGHLFFFLIEGVIRRPVPLKVRQIAAYIGLAMILLLMVVVFANDIQRNWGIFGGLF